MAVTVNIPKNADAITLSQFIKFKTSPNDLHKIMAITGKSKDVVSKWQTATVQQILDTFEVSCNTGGNKLMREIRIDGQLLAFMPDLNVMTLAEHIELETFAGQIWNEEGELIGYQHLPNLMAVMYRPIKERVGKFYKLKEYDPDTVPEYIEYVKEMPLSAVNGALVFFSTIGEELGNSSLQYLQRKLEEAMKEARS